MEGPRDLSVRAQGGRGTPNVLLRAHPPSFHPHTKSTENCSDHSETLMPKLMKLAEI